MMASSHLVSGQEQDNVEIVQEQELEGQEPGEHVLRNLQLLSSVNFQFKTFVKGGEEGKDKEENEEENCESTAEEGSNVKQFYQETLNNPELAQNKKSRLKSEPTIAETIELIESSDEELEVIDTKSNKALLVAVTNGDLAWTKTVKNCDYNCRDEHGWTPLEIAAVMGHEQIVKFLLKRDGYIRDNEKILEILRKKGLETIIQILSGHCRRNNRSKIPEKMSQSSSMEMVDLAILHFVTCPECSADYNEEERSQHLASLPHLLATSKPPENINPGFGIPEGNLGFRMLQKGGWDGRRGLKEGRGRLFPVKTALRKGRKGLAEGDRKGARITHGSQEIQEAGKRERRPGKPLKKSRKPSPFAKESNEVPVERMIREDIGEL